MYFFTLYYIFILYDYIIWYFHIFAYYAAFLHFHFIFYFSKKVCVFIKSLVRYDVTQKQMVFQKCYAVYNSAVSQNGKHRRLITTMSNSRSRKPKHGSRTKIMPGAVNFCDWHKGPAVINAFKRLPRNELLLSVGCIVPHKSLQTGRGSNATWQSAT